MAKLLLVDDEVEILEALNLILSAEGHETLPVHSGEAVIDLLNHRANGKPDLIIADVVMPGLSGLDLVQAVRGNPAYADLPMLFISASVSADVQAQLVQQEHVSFLSKPFPVEALCTLISTLCA